MSKRITTERSKSSVQWMNSNGALGIWCSLPTLHTAEAASRSGAEWLCFDLQHGLMDFGDLLALMPAVTGTGITVLVRVAANQPDQIGRVLDLGADGVIVPMVNTPEEAARAATACRYPPAGERSCGPLRPALIEGFEYLNTANDRVMCLPMIETREGLDNVAAIAAIDGIDGLFVGPMDLCYGLGITPGDFTNDAFVTALNHIVTTCRDNEKPAGMFGYDAKLAHQALEEGFSFASIGSDISFFREGLAAALSIARGESSKVTKSTGY